ncbi:MAG: Mrp/NBP35 family ATP-binding protein [Kordiimonadaceae bacterium]|nr:Mrp/NBP35 family ATP-binding protein [Kordiimonadaceae bacterium]MBO6569009.1 Mrp/NBP35 family ATP-binding protein [Kordiimonadaceae bacterium]MBO6964484.1 Mrp/NBP35 family ATP-binding protein [Kordiimonadaceae bacterium]
MNANLKETVENFLKNYSLPGADKDIVSAKIVSAVIVNDGQVGIILDFGSELPESASSLRSEIESAVGKLAGVTSANVVVTSASKQQPGRTASGPRPVQPAPTLSPAAKAPPTPTEIPGVKHIIAVASGKGGVGKSTTSVNLALALKERGLSVGIMDADIFGPSLPMLTGLDAKPETKDKIIQPLEAHGLKLMSIGFLIDVDQPVVWRGPRVMGATQQLLKDVAWGPLDVLIVDMPPGTGDVQLTMVQQAPLSGAVIVSTPQDLALIDARKGLAMFQKVNVPIFGIIENMTSFVCPHCGGESHIFGHGGAQETAAKLGCEFLGGVPLEMDVRLSADSGTPIMVQESDSAAKDVYRSIAEKVASKLS